MHAPGKRIGISGSAVAAAWPSSAAAARAAAPVLAPPSWFASATIPEPLPLSQQAQQPKAGQQQQQQQRSRKAHTRARAVYLSFPAHPRGEVAKQTSEGASVTDAAAMVTIAEAEVVPISPASSQAKSYEEGKVGKQGGMMVQGGEVEVERALKVVLRRGEEGRLVTT